MIQRTKKIILGGLLTTALFATTANAGVLVDAEVGAGSWKASPSGYVNYNAFNADIEETLGLSHSYNAYIYADFNHFVPIVPNIRIEHQALKMDASATNNFTWNGQTISVGNKTELDLTQQDLILYWSVPLLKTLTTGILRVDVGLDIKNFNGSVSVNDKTSDLGFILPMGYIGATIDPPFVPATLSASHKTISYNGSSINDTMLKVSINLPIPIPLIDTKLDLGYKKQSLKLSKDVSDNLTADIKFSGLMLGVSAKF